MAAPAFDKARTGWVFKTDTLGTGYYLDPKVPRNERHVARGWMHRHHGTASEMLRFDFGILRVCSCWFWARWLCINLQTL